MSNTTNIDKLVYDYILSSYFFKKSRNGHDLLFNKNGDNINGVQLVTEINLVFDYDPIKTFILITEFGHKQNRILFEFWNTKQYLFDALPNYMKNHIWKHDYSELYQDFYLESLDT